MNCKLALLPVDARPVTRDLPIHLAQIGGWEIIAPDKGSLGFLKEPGKIEDHRKWLLQTADEVGGFILSIDMLLYGGLVPSRVSAALIEELAKKLQLLKEIKVRYPDKPLYAFSSTMRISNNYVNEEEKEYWNQYGEELWTYSYHSHRYEKTGDEVSKKTVDQLRIPQGILSDYTETRERNFKINLQLLDYVEDEILDFLVFPQDDTAEYGFNIREQEVLAGEVLERGLSSRVLIYPGADEVASTLAARMIYQLENEIQPRFYPFYSGEKGALLHAMYEDRPIAESVKGQIFAAGSHTVDSAAEAEILLAVNVPGKAQGDLALQKHLGGVHTADRNVGEWIARLKYYLRTKPVAVADLAYANGADPAMMKPLLEKVNLLELSGFGAWNTAGNTLGTVVSQACLRHLAVKKGLHTERKHQEQLLARAAEDYLYQTVVRQAVRKQIDEENANLEELVKLVSAEFLKTVESFKGETGFYFDVEDIHLPWNRTFEIGFTLRR
ncbi:DUF4127 family protein [Bacillus sp. FSL H8-0547]